MKSNKMQIRDTQTREVHTISASVSVAYIDTKDGVRVRLHPIFIKTFVKRSHPFEGHHITGTREFIRL